MSKPSALFFIRFAVFIATAFSCEVNWAESLLSLRWKELESPFLHVMKPYEPADQEVSSKYPWFAAWLKSNLLKYYPTVRQKMRDNLIDKSCDFNNWMLGFNQRTSPPSQEEFSRHIATFFSGCGSRIKKWPNDILTNTLKTMNLAANVNSSPWMRPVKFNLGPGAVLKGLLGLKPGPVPRPLIIVRLGIFSNASEFLPERFLLSQLFYESPFHILLLESSSSEQFIARNQRVSFGGTEEGLQNYALISQLRSAGEPISKYIQSVHLVGMSLGGHSIFTTLAVDQANGTREAIVKSALGLCPVVDLKQTFDHHHGGRLSSAIVDFWSRKRLQNGGPLITNLQPKNFFDQLLNLMDDPQMGPQHWLVRQGAGGFVVPAVINPNQNFWARNDLWRIPQRFRIPLLILATPKDPIVPFDVNSEQIIDGRIDLKTSPTNVIRLPEGYHCSFPGAYDWWTTSQLLQEYIIYWSGRYHLQARKSSDSLRSALHKELLTDWKKFLIEWDVDFSTQKATGRLLRDVWWARLWAYFFNADLDITMDLSETEFGPLNTTDLSADELAEARRAYIAWLEHNTLVSLDGRNFSLTWTRWR